MVGVVAFAAATAYAASLDPLLGLGWAPATSAFGVA